MSLNRVSPLRSQSTKHLPPNSKFRTTPTALSCSSLGSALCQDQWIGRYISSVAATRSGHIPTTARQETYTMGTQQSEVIAMSLSGCLALRWKNFLIPTYFHLSEGIIAPMHSSEHTSLNSCELR